LTYATNNLTQSQKGDTLMQEESSARLFGLQVLLLVRLGFSPGLKAGVCSGARDAGWQSF
jgi:hypothetical protein